MYCDDCGTPVRCDMTDYVQQKEVLGTVICSDCRNSMDERGQTLIEA